MLPLYLHISRLEADYNITNVALRIIEEDEKGGVITGPS
jgi:hypothetical protein